MALMQPAVVGPLSELSASVRVRGQLPGATVTVESATRTLAKGVATSGDQRFPLEPGMVLSRAESIFARQHIGGDSSDIPSGNQAMPVAAAPASAAEFGNVNVATHLYACGRFVWVDGAVPGADVTMLANGAVIGTGKADEGVARFGLTSAIPDGGWIVAHQSAPGLGPGPDVGRAADRIPGGPGRPLPPPVLQLPIRGCDASIQVTGVFDGATVTIERRSGIVDSAGFDLGSERFILSQALVEDDELTVRQEVDRRCERQPQTSGPVTVGKLEPVDPPVVVAPLCAGATAVRVTGLRAGATVHLAANQTIYDGSTPPDQTWLDCRIPALTTDPVSATQEACGVISAPAAAVSVDPHEAGVPAPTVLGPLFSCTASISVTNAHRGALLQAVASGPAGDVAISDQVLATSTNMVIGVAPLLIEGTKVFVRQWACSDTSTDSGDQPVQAHPAPAPVDVAGPLTAGSRSVGVRGVLPGAAVEVYVLSVNPPLYLGAATADALHPVTMVGLSRELVVEERIGARQRLCGRLSEPRTSVTVEPPAGFGPRPFYVVGHNPNTTAKARDDVNAGATALEPDVQVYEDHPEQLCISHGTGDSSAPSLVAYLNDVHQLAAENPQLSLIVFDCKTEATSPDHGFELLTAIRQNLTFDNDLNVIISVGKISSGQFFDRIIDILGPREGLMVDAEDDPGAVTNYFTGRGVEHQGYGNGISFANFILGPYYRYTLEGACGIRAQVGRPRFIYVWTVNSHADLREYIRIGVDGAITDDVGDLVNIAAEAEFAGLIRPATRADNPFHPGNFGYGLRVHTTDKWMAGTDANVTFTLHGSLGSASKTVNTDLVKRMESGSTNWVTIQSDDLGALQSITVQRDNSGNGPDWHLDRIDVRSDRFGTAGSAVFDRWIDSTSPFTEPLV
jgi:hypothetical protein